MTSSAPRPTRLVAGFLIAGVVVLALLLGGGAGIVLGAPAPQGRPSPAPEDPPELLSPPELPAEFPDASIWYLPGVTVDAIVAGLSDHGWTCQSGPPRAAGLGAQHHQECEESEFGPVVAIHYDSDTEVRLVTGECFRRAGDPADHCREPFQQVATAVFDAQPAGVGEQAVTWVAENAQEASITHLGGLELSIERLELESGAEYTFQIAPAGFSRQVRCLHSGEPGCG